MTHSHKETLMEIFDSVLADRNGQLTSVPPVSAPSSSSAPSLRRRREAADIGGRVVDTIERVPSATHIRKLQPFISSTNTFGTRNTSTSLHSRAASAYENTAPPAQQPSQIKQGGFPCSRTSNSSPGQLRPSLGANQPKARRFNHTGPLATPMQKLRANLELWKNEGPITPVAYAPVSEMAAEIDFDMENVAPNHDLGTFSCNTDQPLELMSMDQFEKEHPFTPPPPRRTTNPLRTTSKNGQFAAEFQLACDARGIPRDFVYYTVAQGCFDVELKLDGDFVDRIGQYASKKDAKEEICKKHLATVELMPNLKKRKASELDCLPPPAGLGDEPWVNLVHGNFPHRALTYMWPLTSSRVHSEASAPSSRIRHSDSDSRGKSWPLDMCAARQGLSDDSLWRPSQVLLDEGGCQEGSVDGSRSMATICDQDATSTRQQATKILSSICERLGTDVV